MHTQWDGHELALLTAEEKQRKRSAHGTASLYKDIRSCKTVSPTPVPAGWPGRGGLVVPLCFSESQLPTSKKYGCQRSNHLSFHSKEFHEPLLGMVYEQEAW